MTAIRIALEEFTLLYYPETTLGERKEFFHAFFVKIIWWGTHAELVFADGKTRKIMPLIDGKFSTENLLDSIPEDLRLKTRRMDPARECVVVDCFKPLVHHVAGLYSLFSPMNNHLPRPEHGVALLLAARYSPSLDVPYSPGVRSKRMNVVSDPLPER